MSTQTVRDMASVVLEEQFRCCICLDTYIDPVSIPCGHNFCLDCIEGYWDTKEKSECPLCKKVFPNRPELCINRPFAEIIKYFQRPQNDERDTEVAVPMERTTAVSEADSNLCRKHKKPLTMFCKNDQISVCEKCIEREHRHHKTIPMVKESNRLKTILRDTKSDIQYMIMSRLRKMEEIVHTVDLSKKITEQEIESSSQACSLLIASIEKHHEDVVKELTQRQEESEKRAEKLLDELEQEIRDLHKRNSKLQQLELTQDPLRVLQSFPYLSKLPSTKDWSQVVVHSDNCLGTVRKAITKLVDVYREIENKLSEEEADRMNQYAVDLTLDPDTASGWLVLSADRKQVSCQKKKNPLPDSPQRFDSCVCVLGKQSFTSGRSYWVVQVGDKTDWDLGVARESIKRKGAITVRPDSGYWAICRRKGGNLFACAGPSVNLHLQKTPQKVGIFLDYEEGSVSFYDAEAKTHIYTYSGCAFNEPLYPYFNPCVQDNGTNVAPLVVCPVEGRITHEQDITIESC